MTLLGNVGRWHGEMATLERQTIEHLLFVLRRDVAAMEDTVAHVTKVVAGKREEIAHWEAELAKREVPPA